VVRQCLRRLLASTNPPSELQVNIRPAISNENCQSFCMASSMRAVVLSAPGPVDNLQIHHIPLPEPKPGWVRIKVEAFGLNRSELHTRLGLAEGVIFPRVLGHRMRRSRRCHPGR
jgi:hypothetical protein